jgi:hypothetical protein
MRKPSRPKTGQPPRNLLHDHPLLGKGRVHAKTRKAERRSQKVRLRRDEWGQHSAFAA